MNYYLENVKRTNCAAFARKITPNGKLMLWGEWNIELCKLTASKLPKTICIRLHTIFTANWLSQTIITAWRQSACKTEEHAVHFVVTWMEFWIFNFPLPPHHELLKVFYFFPKTESEQFPSNAVSLLRRVEISFWMRFIFRLNPWEISWHVFLWWKGGMTTISITTTTTLFNSKSKKQKPQQNWLPLGTRKHLNCCWCRTSIYLIKHW